MKYREGWASAATKFVFKKGQLRSLYLSASPPRLVETTEEARALQALGYSASALTKMSQVRSEPWSVLITPNGLHATRGERFERPPPGLLNSFNAFTKRLSTVDRTSRIRHNFPEPGQSVPTPRYFLRAFNARWTPARSGDGPADRLVTSLPGHLLDDLLSACFGEAGAEQDTPLILESGTRYSRSSINGAQIPEWDDIAPVSPGTTVLCTDYQDVDCMRRLWARVPEIIPGLRRVIYGSSYAVSWMHNCRDPNVVFGISHVTGTESCLRLLRMFGSPRPLFVTTGSDTAMWHEHIQVRVVPETNEPTTAIPYLFDRVEGEVGHRGLVAGRCYMAAMPEFVDSFCLLGPLTTRNGTMEMDGDIEIGLSFPPEILETLRATNPSAPLASESVPARIYSWIAKPAPILTGLLGRTRLASLAQRGGVSLADETIVDEPARQTKVTFGQAASRAEGQNFGMCHFVEPDSTESIVEIEFQGSTASLSAQATLTDDTTRAASPDEVIAAWAAGTPFATTVPASGTAPVPTLEDLFASYTGANAVDVTSDTEAKDFDVARAFGGSWPKFTHLDGARLAAVQIASFAIDQRSLHQLAATSVAWSQFRVPKRV